MKELNLTGARSLHVDLHLLVDYLHTVRHIYSPATSFFFVVGDTTYQTTHPVQRQRNSSYTCNSTSSYMNSPEILDNERKRKAQIPFSARSRSQFSSASDASQLQQKTNTLELLDAPYRNSCAHLDDSSQLCCLFLAPPNDDLDDFLGVATSSTSITINDHQSLVDDNPAVLLQVVPLNDNHLSPRLRQCPRHLIAVAPPNDNRLILHVAAPLSDYIARSSSSLHQRLYCPPRGANQVATPGKSKASPRPCSDTNC